jgi:hypothetical protein
MAVVSHSKRLIFIAVPKTGSTSVMNALNDGSMECRHRHERAREARVRWAKVWDAYEKIGFVREPKAWADSYFRFVSDHNRPIAAPDRFLKWTPTPYDWLIDDDGQVIVDNIYRTEDLGAVLTRYGLSPRHDNSRMNGGITLDLGGLEDRFNAKFHRELAHYG